MIHASDINSLPAEVFMEAFTDNHLTGSRWIVSENGQEIISALPLSLDVVGKDLGGFFSININNQEGESSPSLSFRNFSIPETTEEILIRESKAGDYYTFFLESGILYVKGILNFNENNLHIENVFKSDMVIQDDRIDALTTDIRFLNENIIFAIGGDEISFYTLKNGKIFHSNSLLEDELSNWIPQVIDTGEGSENFLITANSVFSKKNDVNSPKIFHSEFKSVLLKAFNEKEIKQLHYFNNARIGGSVFDKSTGDIYIMLMRMEGYQKILLEIIKLSFDGQKKESIKKINLEDENLFMYMYSPWMLVLEENNLVFFTLSNLEWAGKINLLDKKYFSIRKEDLVSEELSMQVIPVQAIYKNETLNMIYVEVNNDGGKRILGSKELRFFADN